MRLLSALALSVASLQAANDIESTKEYYDATLLPSPITTDGSLAEWAGVPVLSDPKFSIPKGSGPKGTGTYVLFEEYSGGTWTGPDDQTSAVQVAWDADYLYIGVVVTDDYHENSANSPWNGDSVQMMIANGARSSQIGLYNFSLGGIEGEIGDVITQIEAGPEAAEIEAVIVRNSSTKKTIYEIRLNAAALGLSQLTAGTKVGMGMCINDGDELTPGQRGWGGLGAHSIVHGKTPSETALLTLTTNLPGKDVLFFSAINSGNESITFRVNNKGGSVLDTNTVKLTVDGTVVALKISATGDGTVDYIYTPSPMFAGGSEHTYVIEAADKSGQKLAATGTFKVAAYAYLTAADKVTPDTSKPGFIWNIHQNATLQANDNFRPLQQLAGLLGVNTADRNATGAALGAGTAGATTSLPVKFEVSWAINLNGTPDSPQGNIQPDDTMPGTPGTDGTTDGVAAEVITYLDLPAGKSTFIVNSDDGFLASVGAASKDVFLGQKAGEYVGGRGASDTSFSVYAAEAGVYPFRVVYENGNGGVNVEFLNVLADGTKVLVNDTAQGGFKAYRAATLAAAPAIIAVSPGATATGVAFDAPVTAVIQDGDTAVDTSSVKLAIDGVAVTPEVSKANGLTKVIYTPSAYWTSAKAYTASLIFTAGATTRTQAWTFTVISYGTLTKAHQASGVNTSKPGFLWQVFQNESYQYNSLASTELLLAGQMTNSSGAYVTENLADPNATGVAAGAGVKSGVLYKFEIPTVINLSQDGGDSTGHFTPDDQMPGIPGTTGVNDGIEAEVITYVNLPAGVVTFGVVSDDSFRVQAGYINKPADGIVLGQADGSTADTTFRAVVKDAGIYPLRVIWQEGGGGANLELFTVNSAGERFLIGDTANGGYAAYRVGTAPSKPANFSLAVAVVSGKVQISWTETGATLQESTDLKSWNDVAGAASPYSPATASAAAKFYRLIE